MYLRPQCMTNLPCYNYCYRSGRSQMYSRAYTRNFVGRFDARGAGRNYGGVDALYLCRCNAISMPNVRAFHHCHLLLAKNDRQPCPTFVR